MGLQELDGSDERFLRYIEGLAGVIGHADRVGPLRDYCTGLMLPCERKSVEPIAAVTAPARTAAQHQCLLHFVGQAAWSDDKVLGKVREIVLPQMERHSPIEAWIIDDTGFPLLWVNVRNHPEEEKALEVLRAKGAHDVHAHDIVA